MTRRALADNMQQLSDKVVEELRLKPEQSERTVWDTQLPGFGCRIQGTGKAWVLRLPRQGGRSKLETLGSVNFVSIEIAKGYALERIKNLRNKKLITHNHSNVLERHKYPIDSIQITGIYFLFSENNVVYVGQSVSVISRILTHISNKVINFDSFAYVACLAAELDKTEQKYIDYYKPIYNKTWKTKPDFHEGDHNIYSSVPRKSLPTKMMQSLG